MTADPDFLSQIFWSRFCRVEGTGHTSSLFLIVCGSGSGLVEIVVVVAFTHFFLYPGALIISEVKVSNSAPH